MIEIREVLTKKERKEFLNFPIKLYKGNPYFVPPLYSDEKKIFDKDYVYNEICDVVFYLAYKDGKVAGRISGIIQRSANEKWGQTRARFTRFDCIYDQDVADALFDAAVSWAKDKGMTEIVGPLGYSDLEREGLLIEGFDYLSTYEEQYNYSYYQKLIENYGFEKDVDWLEYMLFKPKTRNDKIKELSRRMLDRYGLTPVQSKSINDFIKDYADQFFEIIDDTYSHLYGTMPFTRGMIDMMIAGFKSIVRKDDVVIIVDKNGRAAGFAVMFPSIAEAVAKSNGKMTLPFIFRFLRTKRKPKVIDLGLIGVRKEYESKGIATIMIARLLDMLHDGECEHLETNLMLEENAHILNLTKNFDRKQHKRRRCYIKQI